MAGLGLAALALSAVWLARPDEAATGDDPGFGFVLPVTLTTLERGDVHPRALLSGNVRAARRARLGFDAAGLIEELCVGEADRVAAGQILAHLDRGDEERALAGAEAALRLAQREHELLLAGEREEEKRRLLAVLEAAGAEAELARLEVGRGEKILVDKILSQSEHDRRQAAWRAADKRRVAADEEYQRALAGTRPEDLAIAAARVDEARTRQETAHYRLQKTELVAPWDGSVVLRFVSEGDYVAEGDPVFELVDTENLEVHVEVPGRFAPHLGEHARVRITVWRDDDFAIERALDAIIPAADEQARSFRAIVRPSAEESRAGRLKPGMFVNIELLLQSVRDALVLPSDCVLANEHGTYVVRALPAETAPPGDGAKPALVADFVPVRVLAEADSRSAVASLGAPLAAGDAIVLVGADNAFPGASLLPRETEEGASAGLSDPEVGQE